MSQLIKVIHQSIDELNENLNEGKPLNKTDNTILFGKGGQLDSLVLVNLFVLIEQNIEDKLDATITIADERAMSQKNSPFKTIGTLTNYIDMVLKQGKNI